jgi:hypothetical protein
MAAAAQGLGRGAERDQVAARADRAVTGDGRREAGAEHRGERVDDVRRDARGALGQRPGTDQQGGPHQRRVEVRAVAGAEVGERVVGLVAQVGPAGVADQRAETGRAAVDRAVVAEHLAEEVPAGREPLPVRLAERDRDPVAGGAKVVDTQRRG